MRKEEKKNHINCATQHQLKPKPNCCYNISKPIKRFAIFSQHFCSLFTICLQVVEGRGVSTIWEAVKGAQYYDGNVPRLAPSGTLPAFCAVQHRSCNAEIVALLKYLMPQKMVLVNVQQLIASLLYVIFDIYCDKYL